MRSLTEDVPVAFMRQSSSYCPTDSLGCLPCNLSLAQASGTNLASRSSFGTTSVSSSRTVAGASTTAWPGKPARRHRHTLKYVHLSEAIKQRKVAGLTVEPELLAHISPLGWAHTLLNGEHRWSKRR